VRARERGPAVEFCSSAALLGCMTTTLHTRTYVPGGNPEEDEGNCRCPFSPRIRPSWNIKALQFPPSFP